MQSANLLSGTVNRSKTILHSALEIENEVFWLSMTSAGYAGYIARRVETLKNMSNTSAWMDDFSRHTDPSQNAVYNSMKKAIKYRGVHQRQQEGDKKKGQRYSSDSDDDD